MSNGNGKSGLPPNTSQVILTFDHLTFELKLEGEMPNHDVTLAMLAQATRTIEQVVRMANAAAMMQQQRQQAEAQHIAQSLKLT